jgi:hypothetical protein
MSRYVLNSVEEGEHSMEGPAQKSQSDKFKDTARELGCDEDEARWDERLRRVAKQRPPQEPSQSKDDPSFS